MHFKGLKIPKTKCNLFCGTPCILKNQNLSLVCVGFQTKKKPLPCVKHRNFIDHCAELCRLGTEKPPSYSGLACGEHLNFMLLFLRISQYLYFQQNFCPQFERAGEKEGGRSRGAGRPYYAMDPVCSALSPVHTFAQPLDRSVSLSLIYKSFFHQHVTDSL